VKRSGPGEPLNFIISYYTECTQEMIISRREKLILSLPLCAKKVKTNHDVTQECRGIFDAHAKGENTLLRTLGASNDRGRRSRVHF